MSQIYDSIEKALKDAIQFHNDGYSATEAVAKSASLHELNPETICRVVEGFNIAKTNAYVKKASIKDGIFEVANKAEAIKKVFGEVATKAEVKPSESFFNFSRQEEEDKKSPEFIFDLNDKLKVASLSLEEEISEINQAKLDISSVRHSFERELQKVASFFSYQHNQDRFDELMDAVAYEYFQNETAQKVASLVSAVTGLEYEFAEPPVPTTYGYSEFHDIFDQMVDDADEYCGRAREYNKRASELNQEVKELEEITSNHIKNASGLLFSKAAQCLGESPKPSRQKIATIPEDIVSEFLAQLAPVAETETKEIHKSASSFLKSAEQVSVPVNLGGLIDLGKIPVFNTPEGGSAGKELADKGYLLRLQGNDLPEKDIIEAELQNVRREALLRDLLANDEIISSYDPEVVVSAYNTLSQLAPKASMIPDVARSVLRYATGQTIDPHYATQIVELENSINKQLNSSKYQNEDKNR